MGFIEAHTGRPPCDYPSIPNTSKLPYHVLPALSPDSALPSALTSPEPPTRASKNIFAFWNTGLSTLPPYLLRNVVAWYRRFAPLGWNIYVLDNVPGSPLNVSHYIDTTSTSIVPEAYINGALSGQFAAQHTSDLIRYPLLLKYGGAYLDVGILQFGDLDWLWTQHIANPASPRDFAGFTMGLFPEISIVNFAMMCTPDNPLVARAHYILLQVWQGKTNTTGAHLHSLVAHCPLMRVPHEVAVDDEGEGKMVINDQVMTDYAIQIQCMGSAQRWIDDEDNWNGPEYVKEKCWLYSMIEGAMTQEQIANWSGKRQFDVLSLPLPGPGEKASEDQRLARQIVETAVGQSWCIKLGHGFSAKLFGEDTLGMRWRKHGGSDCKEGTYAGWLRWAEVNCRQDVPMEPMKIPAFEPTMRGQLMH
ncbi:hypothetical protein EJ04DRAFT_511125 [Polyplosphaeria fusca]|uniref:Capsule polysaccharide biosynthesis protein n=1 Tax=Polyplosphaeria fusca TaxID=682080 RepID=A0A9P4R3K8_9PLEO|nr:hypothetical protein EJ04DRAFT_511125 [Polyplosphaeria fusca]